MTIPFETFAPLTTLDHLIIHAFSLRTDLDTKSNDFPSRFVHSLGHTGFASAEQPHGNLVARADVPVEQIPGVDALITDIPDLPLIIRCADCAPIFLVDPATPAIGLIHSGKKGTFANIAGNTVTAMQRDFACQPDNLIAYIGPSIGSCHYDLDLWTLIENQLRAAGLRDIHNPHTCTACHLDRYFSYRAEKSRTGRMFALLSLQPSR